LQQVGQTLESQQLRTVSLQLAKGKEFFQLFMKQKVILTGNMQLIVVFKPNQSMEILLMMKLEK
jgi:hypothetical protein